MKLSIEELSKIVGKPAGYIRQHISRGHLRTERAGRRVWITISEARRWAKQRNLPFSDEAIAAIDRSHDPSLAVDGDTARTARIRVLASRSESPFRNILTTVRIRRDGYRRASWSEIPGDLGEDLILLGADVSVEEAETFVKAARTRRVSEGGAEIAYILGPRRIHFSGRGEQRRMLASESLPSPFAPHSAKVVEFWAAEGVPLVADDVLHRAGLLWRKLGLNLADWSDRMGNLVVFEAMDELTVEVKPEPGALRFLVETATPFRPGQYLATVSLFAKDDVVAARSFALDSPAHIERFETDFDGYNLLVYRTKDGECVEEKTYYLIKRIHFQMSAIGPSVSVQARSGKEIRRFRSQGILSIPPMEIGESDPIGSRQLARRLRNKERRLRTSGDLDRFPPEKADEAAQRLIKAVAEAVAKNEVVYVADRYFFKLGVENDFMNRLFVGLIDAAQGKELRILHSLPLEATTGWTRLNPALRRNVQARRVCQINHGTGELCAAFHDRYVASASGEVLYTHSINGWAIDGVTFVRLGHGVYYTDAEDLWNKSGHQWLIEELWP